MADLFSVRHPAADLTVPDNFAGSINDASSLSTGDIRRKYNFGNRVSELALAQDPFFRFLSMAAKKPTDDPQFKYAEKRGSWHKRYSYVVGWVNSAGAAIHNNAEIKDTSGGALVKGNTVKLYMATDYQNKGNLQNVYGQSSGKIDVGNANTDPNFFLNDQVIKVNLSATATGGATIGGYALVRITNVAAAAATASLTGWDLSTGAADAAGASTMSAVLVTGEVVRAPESGAVELCSFRDDKPLRQVYSASVADVLEAARSYVVGTAHLEGSGFPDTWKDQPYSFNHGQTQIWKTSMAMTNTARATSLKYDSSEWARIWKEKLIEHKWDIEQSLLFGSQVSQGDYNYTQGAIDFVLSNGNVFNLDTTTKTADDFLDDLSNYVDPRYNNSQATVFFCDTATYNWMHKLGGYFKNNLEVSPQFRADMAITGKKKAFGIDITTISTPYGDINVARNIHLDGSSVKIVGINMKNCAWRPLVGNGVNRDTSVYVGVQTLENSGIDRRVDLILTEGGMEFQMPESHAVWKA
jgi:hypothetical protein